MDTMSQANRMVAHPLDPLTPAEIETAVAIVRRERALGDDVLFVSVALHEPPKDLVLAYREGEALERQAFLVLRDRTARATCEAVVSLTAGAVVSWREDGEIRQVETESPTQTVIELASRFADEVPELSVQRPRLEDVYLELIGAHGRVET